MVRVKLESKSDDLKKKKKNELALSFGIEKYIKSEA